MKEVVISVVCGLAFLSMVFGACIYDANKKFECKNTMAQQKYTAAEIFVICEAK